MADRLKLFEFTDETELKRLIRLELKELAQREPAVSLWPQSPLYNCCKALFDAGSKVIVVQTRVNDPDFLAEFNAYYSRQFLDVPRFCTRVHFFKHPSIAQQGVLDYLDAVPKEEYLGFVTLRPIVQSPIGASILSCHVVTGFVRSIDTFPVHLAGVKFDVVGTPFMQQDNAVGACAQASIWMALRTLRKREGDRAHDPAQITDAATRYNVSGRIRPNRQGLTQLQMIEAIRAAGYSTHLIPLGSWQTTGSYKMTPGEISGAMKVIHAYIESEIPVVLILFPPTGGHAVVAIGHTWDASKPLNEFVEITLSPLNATSLPLTLNFHHAISWIPSLLVNNDNTGPYRPLLPSSTTDYSLEYGAFAIPLLPADVFMCGEEAQVLASAILVDIFGAFKIGGLKTDVEMTQLADSLVLRLLLVEKRKLRNWAAKEVMAPELKEQLRLMDLPKRVWLLEIHKAAEYGQLGSALVPTLVGCILIDPTGELSNSSVLLAHFNMPELVGLKHGVIVTWDKLSGAPAQATQTTESGPTISIR